MEFRKNKLYPAYKDSGVEWIGEVPEHWEVKRLKFCMQSRTEKDSKNNFVVALENIEGWTGKYINTEDKYSYEGVLFEKDDILFGKLRPYLAKVYLTPKQGIAIGDFFVFRPIENAKFLFYLLLSESFIQEVNSSTFGAKMPRVSFDFFSNLQLPIPDKFEQLQIASFLDHRTSKIDQLIQEKQELIELLKKKKTALITKCVTKGLDDSVPLKDSGVEWIGKIPEHWTVKSLKWESPVLRGASPRPIDNPKYFDENGEYGWVRIADVTASDTYLTHTKQRLSNLGASLSVKLQPFDFFLSIAGSVGKPCITKIKCCIHDGFVYFPRLSCDTKFLYYVFDSGEPYKGLGKMGTQLNLNTDTVGSIHIGFPPQTEQHQIASYLDQQTSKIDQIINEVQDSIDLLKRYRTSLITHAVTGKIDVRDWSAGTGHTHNTEAAHA